MTLDEKIAQAQRHVDRGRRIVEGQRMIVACHGTQFSIELLRRSSGHSSFSRWIWPICSEGSKAASVGGLLPSAVSTLTSRPNLWVHPDEEW
jgi:hypothetical protein